MLRHTFVTTMLDAGVDLRDVQIAARHADPRTTMRYDRARNPSGMRKSRDEPSADRGPITNRFSVTARGRAWTRAGLTPDVLAIPCSYGYDD
ncbi:site-specific integrase [Kribbella sp. NPDC023972]|uniref:site-specific integrase n=1 Tax=Kribbella sp. NPDC023972 TaxID=3154795 RepID=UPI0033ECD11B